MIMNNYITDADTRAGTITGTLLVLLFQVNLTQLLSTVIVAASGAIASFVVSASCRYLYNRFGKKDEGG